MARYPDPAGLTASGRTSSQPYYQPGRTLLHPADEANEDDYGDASDASDDEDDDNPDLEVPDDNEEYDLNQGVPLAGIPSNLLSKAFQPRAAERSIPSDSEDEDEEDPSADESSDGEPEPGPAGFSVNPVPDSTPTEVTTGRGGTRGRPRGRPRGRGGMKAVLNGLRRRQGSPGADAPPRRRGVRGRPRGSRAKTSARKPRKQDGDEDHDFRRGRRVIAPPKQTPEFNKKQAAATMAWMDGRLEEAADLAREAIQMNPEVFAPYNLLSEVLLQMDKPSESLYFLWLAAITKRDADIWWSVLKRLEALPNSNDFENGDKKLFCYTSILKLNPKDTAARKGRLGVYKERHALGKVIREFENILKQEPFNLELLRDYLDYSLQNTAYIARLRAFWDAAVDHYYQRQDKPSADGFNFDDLDMYMELYLRLKKFPDGLKSLKRLARWLVGRRDEAFWDDYQALDTEWDVDDRPRRVLSTHWLPGRGIHPRSSYGEALTLDLRVKLGMFRLALGPNNVREAMWHFSHLLSALDCDDSSKLARPDLVHRVAELLFVNRYFQQCLPFFQALQSSRANMTNSSLLHLAKAYSSVAQHENAVRILGQLVESEPRSFIFRSHYASALKNVGQQEQAYEEYQTAVKLQPPPQVRRPLHGHQDPKRSATPPQSLDNPDAERFEARTHPVSTFGRRFFAFEDIVRARAGGRRESLSESFIISAVQSPDASRYDLNELQRVSAAMRNGDQDATERWIICALRLLNGFCAVQLFFPSNTEVRFLGYDVESSRKATMAAPAMRRAPRTQIERMAARLGEELGHSPGKPGNATKVYITAEDIAAAPQEYNNILFTTWLDIFCELALLFCRRGQTQAAFDVLQAAASANVFYHDEQYQNQITSFELALSLASKDEQHLFESVRNCLSKQIPGSEGYNLFSAVALLHRGQIDGYNSTASQKLVSRLVKSTDYALMSPEQRRSDWFSTDERPEGVQLLEGASELQLERLANPNGLEQLDPALLTLCGHLMSANGVVTNALNYYVRANMADPGNPLILLCLAVGYLQSGLGKIAQNRHLAIEHGLALVEEYRTARLSLPYTSEWQEKQRVMEVDFNQARIWHFLGMNLHAAEGYKRVLSASLNSEQSVEPGYQREAALGLQSILAASGQLEAARRLSEQWLVI